MCLGSNSQIRKNTGDPSINALSHNLNISFWNINGYKSKILGNKLTDPDFLMEIENSDIIGIGETHIHDDILKELTIPGFVLLEYKNRKKNAQNTSSGGLAIFVRHAIKKIVHPIQSENQDIIWLKMDKKYLDSSNDIYIGTLYISPHQGKLAESKKIQNLAEDVVRFKRQGGNIILQGDFNARTSNDKDFIQPDKYDDANNQTETLNIPLRNSQSHKTK